MDRVPVMGVDPHIYSDNGEIIMTIEVGEMRTPVRPYMHGEDITEVLEAADGQD